MALTGEPCSGKGRDWNNEGLRRAAHQGGVGGAKRFTGGRELDRVAWNCGKVGYGGKGAHGGKVDEVHSMDGDGGHLSVPARRRKCCVPCSFGYIIHQVNDSRISTCEVKGGYVAG